MSPMQLLPFALLSHGNVDCCDFLNHEHLSTFVLLYSCLRHVVDSSRDGSDHHLPTIQLILVLMVVITMAPYIVVPLGHDGVGHP